jgi:hypothetical protein
MIVVIEKKNNTLVEDFGNEKILNKFQYWNSFSKGHYRWVRFFSKLGVTLDLKGKFSIKELYGFIVIEDAGTHEKVSIPIQLIKDIDYKFSGNGIGILLTDNSIIDCRWS